MTAIPTIRAASSATTLRATCCSFIFNAASAADSCARFSTSAAATRSADLRARSSIMSRVLRFSFRIRSFSAFTMASARRWSSSIISA